MEVGLPGAGRGVGVGNVDGCPELDAEWEQAKVKDCPGWAGALEQARSTDFPESDEGSEQEALWAGLDLDAEDCPAPAPVEESAADMGVCLRRDREGVHHDKEERGGYYGGRYPG
jgi:hypothetical protein